MGQKQIYYPSDKSDIIKKAEEFALIYNTSISAITVKALEEFVLQAEAQQAKMSPIQLELEDKVIQFIGEVIARQRDYINSLQLKERFGLEISTCFTEETLYLTRKGKFLLYSVVCDQEKQPAHFYYSYADSIEKAEAQHWPMDFRKRMDEYYKSRENANKFETREFWDI